ncbi:hypothetical protein CKJ89_39145, partial [Klebsiella pneumoniae]
RGCVRRWKWWHGRDDKDQYLIIRWQAFGVSALRLSTRKRGCVRRWKWWHGRDDKDQYLIIRWQAFGVSAL